MPVVFFQVFYHDWFLIGVYNNVGIVIYISDENYVKPNVQKEINKSEKSLNYTEQPQKEKKKI